MAALSSPFNRLISSFKLAIVVGELLAGQAASRPPLPQREVFLGNGTVKNWRLQSFGGNLYSVDTTMGTPEQDLRLAVAFGLPYINAPGVDCISSGSNTIGCQSANVAPFNASASSTFQPLSDPGGNLTTLQLGGASALAELAEDVCTAKGITAEDDYIYPNQTVAIAQSSSDLYSFDSSQGILGFGTRAANFSDSLVGHRIANGSLESFVVGFDFQHVNQSATLQDAGEVNWGGVSRPNERGFTWLEVMTDYQSSDWTVHLDGMSFNGQDLKLSPNGGDAVATIEPWFNAFTIPLSVASQISGFNSSSTTNYYAVDCRSQFNISFTLGDHEFFIDTRDAILQDQAACVSSIYTWSDRNTENKFQLGAPFLRSIYTSLVFPGQNETEIPQAIGLSQKVIQTASTSASGSGDGGGGGTNVGAIVGGVVGGVLGLAFLLIAIMVFLHRRDLKRDALAEEQANGRKPLMVQHNGFHDPQSAFFATQPSTPFTPPPNYHGTPQPETKRISAFPQPQEEGPLEGQMMDVPAGAQARRISGQSVQMPGSPRAPVDRFGKPIPQVD